MVKIKLIELLKRDFGFDSMGNDTRKLKYPKVFIDKYKCANCGVIKWYKWLKYCPDCNSSSIPIKIKNYG